MKRPVRFLQAYLPGFVFDEEDDDPEDERIWSIDWGFAPPGYRPIPDLINYQGDIPDALWERYARARGEYVEATRALAVYLAATPRPTQDPP